MKQKEGLEFHRCPELHESNKANITEKLIKFTLFQLISVKKQYSVLACA
jgi:hypothetical protein